MRKGAVIQDMEEALATKRQVVEELTQELEEVRAATDGVQQVNVLLQFYPCVFILLHL